ncbi:MAG: adenylosuccinate lyase, partial [Acholeplasmataceae bacterium]|nr:adenylosuccinate lyase [Acholeplasmataceae bacterium]
SRTEVSEVQEYFDVDQKGSSAMPHKRNPISSENISGLARLLRGYMSTAYENMALWHERDISHSSVERVILPDATSVLDDMLSRYQNTLKNLVINKRQMEKNITMTHGAVFAQGVLHALIDCGYDRSEAYDRIQQMALKSVETDQDLKTQLQNHPDFQKCFSKEKLDTLFDPNSALKFVDIIYQNVFSTTK